MVGYDYLSARARGLLGRLLPAARVRALCALDGVEALLAELSVTPGYAADVAAVAGIAPPLEACAQALERHRVRTARVLWAAAGGEARELIGILLSRHDLEAVKMILRRWHAREAGVWHAPAPGLLDGQTLRALDAAGSVLALADLLALTGPAGAALARALRAAPAARLADLEDRLDVAWAADALARCGCGPNGRLVREVLGWEIDTRNLLAALRGGSEHLVVLPGGRYLHDDLLQAIAAEGDRAAAAAWLAPTPYAGVLDGGAPVPWRRIERALERRVLALHRRMLFASDPLGIAPVSFFLAAKQAEVRNLRTVAAGLAAGVPPSLMEEELVDA
ncbi:MAG: V-type ATPase subunit [Armatimonadota bacterium]|nr:V-type ATPase subunit [Armatimonadota bacterium]MDR7485507.1 V-type ATPase subunit [Armatimonadota bacterium]MDR7533052.1 V-type ATPase subunit [Armatimonadota bacterium]MDR7536776.1 V-type ATPase subunit [Armatimonadota bacterium]